VAARTGWLGAVRGLQSSLAFRLTLLFAVAASLLLVALGVGLGLMLRDELEARDREEIDGKTELVAHLFSDLGSSQRIAQYAPRFADMAVGHPHLLIALRAQGDWLVEPPAPFRPLLDSRRAGEVPEMPGVATWQLEDGLWWVRRIEHQPADGPRFIAYLGLHVDPAQVLVARFYRLMLAAGLLGVAASGLLGWAVARRGLAPIHAISREAERVTAERLGPFLRAEDAPAEIRRLVEAINRMLERLRSSFQALEEFSADIAHELRTPLNNLMLQTQVTLSRSRSGDEYQDALHLNLEELERLQRMVSDMLFLARVDRGMFELKVEPVDLGEETRKLAEFFEIAAAERGKTVVVSGGGRVRCDRSMARRAVTNLLSNAVRYSLPQAEIEVRVDQAPDGSCAVEVRNPAEPVSDDDLRRLFGRFSHGRREGDSLGEGSGLGLSIVDSIMRLHGGSVVARSSAAGVCFRLVFPAAAPGASPAM
jgi:two-component system, OmpR family, heavy metal sensor histidine kinase CusS